MRPLFTRDRAPALEVPSLVAFASPMFRAEAKAELRAADPSAEVLRDPLSGALPEAFALRASRPLEEIAAALREPAIFVRQVMPLARVEEVRDLAAVVAALARARAEAPCARVDLVGLPRELTRRALRESAPGVGEPATVGVGLRPAPTSKAGPSERGGPEAHRHYRLEPLLLSALLLDARLYTGRAPLAASLSPWPAGDPAFPAERISRAEWKLREALLRLEPPLAPGASVLDIGAAPGGFTSVLLEAGARVLAIDPAPLDARLLGHDRLRAVRAYAERVPLEEVPPLDLITCDAVLAPALTASLLARFAPRLAASGRAIVSVKMRPAPSPAEQVATLVRLLAPTLALERVRHLHANRREVTAFLRRSPP